MSFCVFVEPLIRDSSSSSLEECPSPREINEMPLEIRPLNTELQNVASTELHEDFTKIESAVAEFRTWVESCPHLKARTDDQFLVSFLRGCKYKLEKAKMKLDMFYTLRTHMPELMLDRDPLDQKLQAIIRLGVGIPLPKTETPGSPRIMLIRPGTFDPNLFTIQDVIKVSTMINDIQLWSDDNLVVSGQVGILDMTGVGANHFIQYNPTFIKKMTMMSHEGSPIRHRGFHYINTPAGFEQVFNVFKSVMNEKRRKNLFVHGNDMESLYRVIPRRLMPLEYGGKAGAIQDIIDEWEKKILSYRQYFHEDEEQFGVDERLREGTSPNAESLFGVDNSCLAQVNFD